MRNTIWTPTTPYGQTVIADVYTWLLIIDVNIKNLFDNGIGADWAELSLY